MSKSVKGKPSKSQVKTNLVESLKDIAQSSADSFKKDLVDKTPEEFMEQLFGKKHSHYQGEFSAGESLEIDEVISGEREEKEKLKKQLIFERTLRQEEERRLETKTGELKLQLHAIQEEVVAIAQSTPQLAQEIKIAAIQSSIDPGIYHVVFFEKLLEFIKSFRQKIDNSIEWLQSVNKRAMKKNYWNTYKKHGSKFLLAPDHFLQRSAG